MDAEKVKKALEEFISTLDDRIQYQERAAKNIPHRIKWKGKFVKTRSGKTVWKRIGDAKSAFNLEIGSLVHETASNITGEKYPSRSDIKAVYNAILNSGLVEFVPWIEE